METYHLQAGSLLVSLRDEALRLFPGLGDRILTYLSDFTLAVGAERKDIDDALFAVADNLISRGRPTLASLRVERHLAEHLGLTREQEVYGSFQFPLVSALSDSQKHLLLRALAPIDPRILPGLPRTPDYEALYDSDLERHFMQRYLPEVAGPWVWQVVAQQRPLHTITQGETEFGRQRVDLSVQLPCFPKETPGLVMEIDGRHHHTPNQIELDKKRDRACAQAGWAPTLRWTSSDLRAHSRHQQPALTSFFTQSYASALAENYASPLWDSDEGMRWLLAALVPLGVSRLQKTLTTLVLQGHLDPWASEWKITIVERDVPCAHLAMADFQDLMGHLFTLEGEGRTLPKMHLSVYRSEAFMAVPGFGPAEPLQSLPAEPDADVLIDLSIVQRPGFSEVPYWSGITATVRTSYWPSRPNIIKAGQPIPYKVNPESEASLLYIMQNLFRKKDFREGQLDVMKSSLGGKSVIGLLPTGAGKSLTYQISALLQPGISLVVAPLKSLMRDQNDNLLTAGIDCTAFINSSLNTSERIRAQSGMTKGHFQFLMISTERLQIQEFRVAVKGLDVPVSYLVVDEAHCVSEWGHDFRTAYLRLGPNARNHCATSWPRLPVIALTGTASFDVLADVRRELALEEDTPTVTPDTFERKELHFTIVPVNCPSSVAENEKDIKEAVFEEKKRAFNTVFSSLPEKFGHPSESFFASDRAHNTQSGLVFTPHANGKIGVNALKQTVEKVVPEATVGTYASSDNSLEEDVDEVLIKTQKDFKANKISTLVATKAFGMGIDKPNIRYVVHFNMSQSIESYYQEAGRAGRDRNPAHCFILYCPQHKSRLGQALPGEETSDFDLLHYFHTKSFKGSDKEKRIVLDLLRGQAHTGDELPNLEQMLLELQPGESARQVTIAFESKLAQQNMLKFLRDQVDARFTHSIVRLACEKAQSAKQIVKKLKWAFNQSTGKWPENKNELNNAESYLSGQFERIRDSMDTFKAVYRLSIIGLISDYTVDYNAKSINAFVVKRKDIEYIEFVQAYVARYVSRERASLVPEEILGHRGENVIHKCLGYLIDFVYSEIESKRKYAIQVMEEAVRDGSEKGSSAFRERINTYFDSRYLPRLRHNIIEYDLDLVWTILEETQGTDDNIRHLRGACDRLIPANPSNAAFHLMRAFTRCLRPESSPTRFQSDFRTGWALFRQEQRLTRTQHLRGIERFRDLILQYDQRMGPFIEAELAHTHTEWLRTFKTQFIDTNA